MANCGCSFIDYICHCVPYDDFIQINTSLTPFESYTWVITDAFSNQYSGTADAESDGTLQIPIAALPDGFLNPFRGKFIIHLEDGSCGPIMFPLAKMYDSVEIEVRGGTMEKNTIGCEIVCSGAGAQNILIPFTDVETVTVTWSEYSASLGNNPSVQVYHLISPGVYQLVEVTIEQIRSNGTLISIEIDNGGPATGYILLS